MDRKNRNTNTSNKRDLFEKMNSFFEKYERAFLWLSLSLGALISIIMFDVKVSLSGDDCDYVINAQDFLQHFTYPGGRGALYPIVISPFLIGGLNLILLKSLSAIFILLSMWLMYKSFCGKVPAAVLMPALLISNICPYIFFYACHTYSEPFFMLTQALFIYLFSKYFWDKPQSSSLDIKTDWTKFLFIGLCFLSMGLTRTIGYAVMGAVILYFCFQKQWKNLIYSLSASLIVFVLFSFIKKIVWPESGAAYDIYNYMAKNFYNVEQGLEDLPGYVQRLIENSNIYLSGFFYQFLGIMPTTEAASPGYPLLSIFTYLLFTVCIIVLYKKNKPLFFTGLYVGTMNFASFVLLQVNWAQDRLIMIYYPLMLLFLLGGLFYLIKDILNGKLTWIYPIILIIITIGTSIHLKEKAGKNISVLQQNILGDDLYGLTPDWVNFVKMSRWANENLDKDAVIASRKPSISYIYTGRNFHGIYNVPYESIGDVLKLKQEDGDNFAYLIIDSPENQDLINYLDPFMQYQFVTRQGGSFSINGKEIRLALSYKIEKSFITEELANNLNENGLNFSFDYDSFLKQYTEENSTVYQIMSPDRIYNDMINSKVNYLILAQIRRYTPQNTGLFINTLHQHLNSIQFKYSGKFRLIHTIGKEEICELVEFIRE